MVEESVLRAVYDTKNAEKRAKELAKSILNVGAAQIKLVDHTTKMNIAGKKQKYLWEQINIVLDDGSRAIAKYNKATKEWEVTYKNMSVSAQEAKKKINELTKAREKAARVKEAKAKTDTERYATIQQLSGLDTLDAATTEQKIKLQESLDRIQSFVRKNDISVDRLQEIWNNLDKNIVLTGFEAKIQKELLFLDKSIKDILSSKSRLEAEVKKSFDIKNLLNPNDKNIDLESKLKLTAASEKIAEFAIKNQIAADRVAEIWNNLDKNISLEGVEAKLQASLLSYDQAIKNMALQNNKAAEDLKRSSKVDEIFGQKLKPLDIEKQLKFHSNIEAMKNFAIQNNLSAEDIQDAWNSLNKGVKLDGFKGTIQKQMKSLDDGIKNIHRKADEAKKIQFIFEPTLRPLEFEKQIKLQKNIEAIKKFAYENKIQADRVEQIWNNLGKTGSMALTGTESTLQRQMLTLSSNIKKTDDQAKNLKNSVKAIFLSWQSIMRLAAIQFLHRMVSETTAAISRFTAEATKMQIKIAEIQTIDNSKLPFREWQEELLKLSDAWGIDIIDQANAAYETLSNQIAEGAESFKFLAEANKFAITTASDSADSINLLSSAINAFKLSTEDTDSIAASFFKTIDLGRVRAEEMADTYGQIAVPAELLGITMNELNAAISITTRQGIKYNNAQTLLRNILLKLIRPTEEMKDFYRDIGVSSGEAAIKTFGFAKVLSLLEERTKGSSDEIGELFNTIRATVGAMIFTGENLNQFNRDLEEITNSTVSYGAAVDTVMDSSGKKVQILGNSIKNFFTKSIGSAFVETIAYFIDLYKEAEKVNNALDFDTFYKNSKEVSQKILALNDETIKRMEIDLVQHIAKNKAQLYELQDDYQEAFEHVYDYVDGNLEKTGSKLDAFNQKLKDTVDSFPQQLKNAKFEYSANIFDFQIKDLDLEEKVAAITKRMNQLTSQNKKLVFFAGTDEQFEQNQQEIIRLFQMRKDIADEDAKAETQVLKKKFDYEKEYTKLLNTELQQKAQLAKTNLQVSQTINKITPVYEAAYKTIKEFNIEETKKLNTDEKLKKYQENVEAIKTVLGIQKKYNISMLKTYELMGALSKFNQQIRLLSIQAEQERAEVAVKSSTAIVKNRQKETTKLNDQVVATKKIASALSKNFAALQGIEELKSAFSAGANYPGLLSLGVDNKQIKSIFDVGKALAEFDQAAEDPTKIKKVIEALTEFKKLFEGKQAQGEFKEAFNKVPELLKLLQGSEADISEAVKSIERNKSYVETLTDFDLGIKIEGLEPERIESLKRFGLALSDITKQPYNTVKIENAVGAIQSALVLFSKGADTKETFASKLFYSLATIEDSLKNTNTSITESVSNLLKNEDLLKAFNARNLRINLPDLPEEDIQNIDKLAKNLYAVQKTPDTPNVKNLGKSITQVLEIVDRGAIPENSVFFNLFNQLRSLDSVLKGTEQITPYATALDSIKIMQLELDKELIRAMNLSTVHHETMENTAQTVNNLKAQNAELDNQLTLMRSIHDVSEGIAALNNINWLVRPLDPRNIAPSLNLTANKLPTTYPDIPVERKEQKVDLKTKILTNEQIAEQVRLQRELNDLQEKNKVSNIVPPLPDITESKERQKILFPYLDPDFVSKTQANLQAEQARLNLTNNTLGTTGALSDLVKNQLETEKQKTVENNQQSILLNTQNIFGTYGLEILQKKLEAERLITEEQKKQKQSWTYKTDQPTIYKSIGYAVRGKDTIPAMLSPGEFVMSSKASQKFYSQFVAMNARGYSTGGSVQNTFGPMSFNISSSGNEQIDAIKLAKAIKREIRRGTVSL